MKITYSPRTDALYIYLYSNPFENIKQVDKTYPCDPMEVNGEIYLDFGQGGQLIGIEIQNASVKVLKELINVAEEID